MCAVSGFDRVSVSVLVAVRICAACRGMRIMALPTPGVLAASASVLDIHDECVWVRILPGASRYV